MPPTPRQRPPAWLEAWHASTWRGPLFTPVDPPAGPVRRGHGLGLAGLFAVDPGDSAGDDAGGDSLREVAGLAVPWRAPVVRWGIRVQFTPETLRVPEGDDLQTVALLVQHDQNRPVGWATAADYAEAGLDMRYAVPVDHPRAAEAMADLDSHLRRGLSIGVELDAETLDAMWEAMWHGQAEGEAVDMAGLVRETSLVSVPQFIGARVTASTPAAGDPAPASPTFARFASEGSTTMSMPTMNRPVAPESAPGPRAAGAAPTPTGAAPDTTGQAGQPLSMAELAAQLAPFLHVSGSSGHPLSRFASLAEFIMAGREGGTRDPEDNRLSLALADQITGNNAGVLPPTWLTEVVGIIDRGRPAVTAFGGPGDAGDSGMTINWPYYDGDLEALVGEQAQQKTEVTTGRVDIKSANATLKTYAGASDISYQLLRRSSPSYRELYSRILSLAFSARTDAVFCADLEAIAVAGDSWDGATAESLLAAIFSASDAVDDAAGVPASVVLAAPDMFALIGAGLGLYPPQYGVQNVPGTASAATLTVSVSGLTITKARHFTAGKVIVSTPEAARWREDGPFAVEADDVAVLGRDIGIWGMGVTTVTVPAAVISVGVVAVPPAGVFTEDTPPTDTPEDTTPAKSSRK